MLVPNLCQEVVAEGEEGALCPEADGWLPAVALAKEEREGWVGAE